MVREWNAFLSGLWEICVIFLRFIYLPFAQVRFLHLSHLEQRYILAKYNIITPFSPRKNLSATIRLLPRVKEIDGQVCDLIAIPTHRGIQKRRRETFLTRLRNCLHYFCFSPSCHALLLPSACLVLCRFCFSDCLATFLLPRLNLQENRPRLVSAIQMRYVAIALLWTRVPRACVRTRHSRLIATGYIDRRDIDRTRRRENIVSIKGSMEGSSATPYSSRKVAAGNEPQSLAGMVGRRAAEGRAINFFQLSRPPPTFAAPLWKRTDRKPFAR